MFNKNKKEASRPGSVNLSKEKGSGPMNEEEVKALVDRVTDIATENKDGFVLAVTATKTDDGIVVEGGLKNSSVNRHLVLETLFNALDMDDNDIMKYLLVNQINSK